MLQLERGNRAWQPLKQFPNTERQKKWNELKSLMQRKQK